MYFIVNKNISKKSLYFSCSQPRQARIKTLIGIMWKQLI